MMAMPTPLPVTPLATKMSSAPAMRRYFLAFSTCSGVARSSFVTTPTMGLANMVP